MNFLYDVFNESQDLLVFLILRILYIGAKVPAAEHGWTLYMFVFITFYFTYLFEHILGQKAPVARSIDECLTWCFISAQYFQICSLLLWHLFGHETPAAEYSRTVYMFGCDVTWCVSDVLVMLWWFVSDVLVMCWWCSSDALVMLIMYWWRVGDILVMF